MQVTVIGTGYVGLVSGACLAALGHRVCCVDLEESKIHALRSGRVPIYEPGLEALVQDSVASGHLSFSLDVGGSVAAAEVVIIAVGTPSRPGEGRPDMRYVDAAARDIARALSGFTVVVTKSTVPVGTGRRIEEIIRAMRPEADFEVASNPEFLREGKAVKDFMSPDRIVIGTKEARAERPLAELYRPLRDKGIPFLATTLETAELIKYASNAFLATKITFINEMADLCEKVSADVEVLATGMGLDRRIGPRFLQAGPGFGGSCFPKDTRALTAMSQELGAPSVLVAGVNAVNERRKEEMAERVLRLLGGDPAGKWLAVWGVTFKADTDDMREAPSLDILPRLSAAGIAVRAYDPAGRKAAEPLLPAVTWASSAEEAVDGTDGLLILTEWNEFRHFDLSRLRSKLKHPLVIDLRNLYALDQVRKAGLIYHSVGRPPADEGEWAEDRDAAVEFETPWRKAAVGAD